MDIAPGERLAVATYKICFLSTFHLLCVNTAKMQTKQAAIFKYFGLEFTLDEKQPFTRYYALKLRFAVTPPTVWQSSQTVMGVNRAI